MRHVCLLIIVAATLPAAGCTPMLVSRGKDLFTLETREQVQQEFGPPTSAGLSDGWPYEDFRSRRKIAEPWRCMDIGMTDICTFGLGELTLFPTELCRGARRVIVGQTIRFTYDSSGKVRGVYLDGGSLLCPRIGHMLESLPPSPLANP